MFSYSAPEQPPPPTVTVGDGGFTIHGLGPMGVVVEYICNYTSVITGVTSQVRMKPSDETADVYLEKAGGYIVQVSPQSLLVKATDQIVQKLFSIMRIIITLIGLYHYHSAKPRRKCVSH